MTSLRQLPCPSNLGHYPRTQRGNSDNGFATTGTKPAFRISPTDVPPLKMGRTRWETHPPRRYRALTHARMFTLPSSFKKHPFIVAPFPMTGNPDGMPTGRMHPPACDPYVAMPVTSPAIIARDPHDFSPGPDNDLFCRRGGRPDVDAYPDMKLCECRDRDGQRSRENRGFQECFHVCPFNVSRKIMYSWIKVTDRHIPPQTSLIAGLSRDSQNHMPTFPRLKGSRLAFRKAPERCIQMSLLTRQTRTSIAAVIGTQ